MRQRAESRSLYLPLGKGARMAGSVHSVRCVLLYPHESRILYPATSVVNDMYPMSRAEDYNEERYGRSPFSHPAAECHPGGCSTSLPPGHRACFTCHIPGRR
jgi:hypothetical protein